MTSITLRYLLYQLTTGLHDAKLQVLDPRLKRRAG